jgi:ribosomal protein L12E/L44/L45/RPP1/RPP2
MPAKTPSAAKIQEWKNLLTNTITNISLLLSTLLGVELTNAINKASFTDKILMKIAKKQAEEASTPYISAAIFLVFAGKKSNKELMSQLLEAAGIQPQEKLLNFALSLDFKNTLAYVPALYFLEVMKRDLTIENLIRVVSAMDVSADRSEAENIISTYFSITSKKGTILPAPKDSMQEKLNMAVKATLSLIAKLMISELNRVIEYKEVADNVDGFMPYVSVVGVLEFVGRDVKLEGEKKFTESIKKIIASVGLTPDDKLASYTSSSIGFGNFPFIYIPALYFLISVNGEATVASLLNVLKAVGIPADEAIAGFIYTFYKDNQ